MERNEKDILLVDDDQDYLMQMEIQFKSAGYKVKTAGSMKEAEEILQGELPHGVVLDLMMEETDAGFTLCHKIKGKNSSIPVILVTSVTSETGYSFDSETMSNPEWIKADVVLPKPVRFEQLERELKRLWGD